MSNALQPFHLRVIALAGWLNRQQQVVIDSLIEENRVLKEQLEGQRLRFTDEQRMRLAVKAKALGRLSLPITKFEVSVWKRIHAMWRLAKKVSRKTGPDADRKRRKMALCARCEAMRTIGGAAG